MRFIYRIYHGLKTFLIVHKPPFLTWVFFSTLPFLERMVSVRREDRLSTLQGRLFQQIYFTRFSRLNPPFILKAESQLAIDSDDHLWPHGTIHDNSKNPRFNLKLYDLLNYAPDLKLLDLGCSGGALVRSLLEDGYVAVGLEGSDVSRKLASAEWKTIPLHLFTCDITKPFHVESGTGSKVLFHAITAWEVLEHIPKMHLSALIQNIHANLAAGGYFIASVATFPDENPLTGAVYHVTLEDKSWWLSQFEQAGFREVTQHKFRTQDWVRGNGEGLTNWSADEPGYGFHLIVQKQSPGEVKPI